MYSSSMNLTTLKKLMRNERGLYLEADQNGFFLHWPNGQSVYLASLEHPFQIGRARLTPLREDYVGMLLTGLLKKGLGIGTTRPNEALRTKVKST